MLKVGDSFSAFANANEQVISDIAKVSGDTNPIHMDDNYAKKSIFGRKIAHGLFCQNMISMIIGNYLPGNGAILISQSFRYCKPVYIGDVIKTTVTVNKVLPKERYVLKTVCVNQENEIVLDGESVVKWKKE